ncbi:MAG TPA: GAF domain-containing protein [Oceanobacillus sp.]|nr:GAF domain-containing protein [Oceanobacillus sp.]
MSLATRYGTPDELLTLRIRFMTVLAWVGIVLCVVGVVPVIIVPLLNGDEFNVRAALVFGAFIVVNALWLFLIQRGRVQLPRVGMVFTMTFTALLTPLAILPLTGFIAVTTAAVLGTTPVFLVATIFVIAKVGFEGIAAVQQTGGTLSTEVFIHVVPLFVLTTTSIIMRYFIWTAERMVVNARRAVSFLQASADIEKINSRLLDLRESLDQSVNLLKNRFRFDHVQVYLLSENDDLVLTAAASTAGRGLLNRGFRVPLGSRHVVDQVVLSNSSLLRRIPISETPQSEDVFPGTRSQLGLPLRDGDRVIGALDIQSEEPDVFVQEDIAPLQVMADLLATAVRNVRLYETQARVAEENQRLYQQAQQSLREIERLNQELTRTSWQDYMKALQQTPGVTLSEDSLIPDAGWTDTLLQAQQERRSVSRLDGDQPVVAVPITLRGEVIGAIEVEPGGQSSGMDAVEMVEAVAQRLAISLENARLYEETQKTAAQEQRINDIAARYQQVTTVDELLRVTLQELSDTLGAQRGTIRLGKIQEVTT